MSTDVRQRARRYGWMPILVLAATQGLDVGERVALSQAVDGLQDQFAVSDSAVGLLPTALVLTSIVATYPLGWLVDRVRRTRLLVIITVIWTLFLVASGAAPTFAVLFVLHIGVGLLQAADPASMSLLGDYEEVAHRARAMGAWQFGAFVGAMVGTLGAGIAVGAGGWRWAFWMWVPLGVLTILALLRIPEPVRGEQEAAAGASLASPAVTASLAGGAGDDAGQETDPAKQLESDIDTRPEPNSRDLFGIPTFWIALLATTLAQVLFLGLSFWGIEYLKRAFEVSALVAGVGGATLGIGAGAGVLLGGTWADRRLARGIRTARVQVAAFGSIASGIVLAAAFAVPTLVAAVPLLGVGGLLLTIPLAPSETLLLDVVRPELRGRASAIRTAARGLSGLAPATIGLLSDALGLRAALVLSSPVLVIAGLVLLLGLRTYTRDLARVVPSG